MKQDRIHRTQEKKDIENDKKRKKKVKRNKLKKKTGTDRIKSFKKAVRFGPIFLVVQVRKI